jgi:hypothetical protein
MQQETIGLKYLKNNKMANKETLEEATNKYITNIGYKSDKQYYKFEKLIQFGAKWQAERMYSEEEVLEHLNHLIMMPSSKLDKFTNDEEMVTMKWFEQFKINKI